MRHDRGPYFNLKTFKTFYGPQIQGQPQGRGNHKGGATTREGNHKGRATTREGQPQGKGNHKGLPLQYLMGM